MPRDEDRRGLVPLAVSRDRLGVCPGMRIGVYPGIG